MTLALILLLFLLLILLGVPIAFAIGITGMVGILSGGEHQLASLAIAPQKFFAGLDMFTFLAMPFFILAGEIMNRSGITARLVDFANALVGYLRGGLAHSNMLASVLFSGMTGAAVSDTAAMGNTMVPAMVKQGYARSFACAVTAAGSIIGPTIPPSNLMVIYGSLMGVSIAGLFAAGILPGLLICAVVMGYIALSAKRLNLPKHYAKASLRRLGVSFIQSLPALAMPALILGVILGGIMTPTEAAAAAIAYAALLGGLIYRSLQWSDFYGMLVKTARLTGVVFLIIAAAAILSWWLTYVQIPQAVATELVAFSEDPRAVIGLVLLLMLAVGLFMDINAALILLAPVLAPVTLAVGMEPIHAGVVIILALNISLMTPPVGACLFVLSSITGERIENISKVLWPFILLEVGILLLIAFMPDVAMWIPRQLGF